MKLRFYKFKIKSIRHWRFIIDSYYDWDLEKRRIKLEWKFSIFDWKFNIDIF